MKKAKKVMGALALTVVVEAGIMWWYSGTSNPWNAKTVGDIDAPAGYTRVEGSYAEFMRRLPLKKRGSRVQLFTGGDAGYQFLSTGVIDLPMLSNWEQCADMTMRGKGGISVQPGPLRRHTLPRREWQYAELHRRKLAQGVGDVSEEGVWRVQHVILRHFGTSPTPCANMAM